MDDISTGASSDLKRATEIAREMVAKYGMSDKVGPICYDTDDEVFLGRDYGHSKQYSENVASVIDKEVEDKVYVAGAAHKEGKLVTNGGRVLGATEIADSLSEAIKASYGLVEKISFDNAFYRHDIGARALKAKES